MFTVFPSFTVFHATLQLLPGQSKQFPQLGFLPAQALHCLKVVGNLLRNSLRYHPPQPFHFFGCANDLTAKQLNGLGVFKLATFRHVTYPP
ncbi:MAG: hypothetical protein AAF998_00280 [Bacteroidota bacterium]